MGDVLAHGPNPDGLWHRLSTHHAGTARRARHFAGKFGAPNSGELIGSCHDAGKSTREWQLYLRLKVQKTPVDQLPHAAYGAHLLARAGLPPQALAVLGHHAGLEDIGAVRELTGTAAVSPVDLSAFPALSAELVEAAAAEIPRQRRDLDMWTRLLFSSLVDADFLDTEAHFNPTRARERDREHDLHSLLEHVTRDQALLAQSASRSDAGPLARAVNEVRQDAYERSMVAAALAPGVFTLKLPTGGGKTRTGLAFALQHAVTHHLPRVVMVSPFNSITTQTAEVYRALLGDEAVLEHHSSVLDDAREGDVATENWDAPVIVTTTVQLMESLLARKSSRLRKVHNLAGAVIVLDEAQALPSGDLQVIVDTLRDLLRLGGGSLVLCSATIPALAGRHGQLEGFEDVRDIIPEAQVETYARVLQRVTYEWRPESMSQATLAAELSGIQLAGGQALVIVNTRRECAQLAGQVPGAVHLSTAMTRAHLTGVLDGIRASLHAGLPCVVVSTSLVEAGVDLDFPVVFRQLTKLDSVIQAAGRCNRHGKRPSGKVVVFDLEGARPPSKWLATAVDQTRIILRTWGVAQLDSPVAVDAYFQALMATTNVDVKGHVAMRAQLAFRTLAESFVMIEQRGVDVIVPQGIEALVARLAVGEPDRVQRRVLQRHTVNVPEALAQRHAPEQNGFRIWTGKYDDRFGVGGEL